MSVLYHKRVILRAFFITFFRKMGLPFSAMYTKMQFVLYTRLHIEVYERIAGESREMFKYE